jgi:hypothetical protein
MAMEIVSGELWDRLELLLGDAADALLPPRPAGASFPHSVRFKIDEYVANKRFMHSVRKIEIVERIAKELSVFAERLVRGSRSKVSSVDYGLVTSAFQARFEYRDGTGRVRDLTVTYTAETAFDAIAAAIRVWVSRQTAPEFFQQLLCVKICEVRFGPIDEDGALFNGASFPFLEWKIDTAGMPFETYAISRIADMLRDR